MLTILTLCLIINLSMAITPKSKTIYMESIEEDCFAIPEMQIQNQTQKLYCCDNIINNLYEKWSIQDAYLTRTLATLQAWNCPQFNEACSSRSLDFTDYTSLIYDRFCNQSSLLQRCGSVTRETLTYMGISVNSTTNHNWTALTQKIISSKLDTANLEQPCIQVALFDSTNISWRNYHEIITFNVPFCNSVWCGFDYETIQKNNISPWTCLPTRCKANIIILVILFIILAVLIVIGNFTVILVYSTAKKLRHSQGVFRLSLGFADIINGVIVLPAAAYALWKTYNRKIKLQSPLKLNGLEKTSSEINSTFSRVTLSVDVLQTYRMSSEEIFTSSFQNSIGFFTTLSLTVSVYLLTVSGIDRLRAISQPLEYPQFKAKRFALISSLVCWIIAIILSLLPVFIDGLLYIISSGGFITLGGQTALFLYLIEFFIPLIATWIVALKMHCLSRRIFKRATNYSLENENIKQQRKLNSILSLLVTAFSLSVLPTILALIFVLMIPATDPRFPEMFSPLFNNIATSLEAVAVIILISNSMWNCVIYSLRTKMFREVAKAKYAPIWKIINLGKYMLVPKSSNDTNSSASAKTVTTRIRYYSSNKSSSMHQ